MDPQWKQAIIVLGFLTLGSAVVMIVQLNKRKAQPRTPPPPPSISKAAAVAVAAPPPPPPPPLEKEMTTMFTAPKRVIMAPRDALNGTVQGTYPWRRIGLIHSTSGDLITLPLFVQHAPFGVVGDYNYAVAAGGATHIVAEHSEWLKDGATVTVFGREFQISMEESFRQFPNLLAVV